ncbi:hypothetical protein ACVIJ6_003243 [Bradyrhizobium sp. USDA 4369]
MNEKRIASRHRVLKAGKISFDGSTIDCSVRNISRTGAALEVASPIGIPQTFILVIEADHVRQLCHVIWRTEKRMGVAFDQN